MAGLSDQGILRDIQAGQSTALGNLFNRYSSPLYEFIYLLIGDREQAARLLEETMIGVHSSAAGFNRGSVRGWLYNLAREKALTFLREKNWLSALPPSDALLVSGLPADIWRAARAMPAFHRAILIVEELHGLSPTEKAQALNVARTDVPRLVEQARETFNHQFDEIARQESRLAVEQVDPEGTWGMHRRIGTQGSLFGYLPQAVLTDSMGANALHAVLATTHGILVSEPTPPTPALAPESEHLTTILPPTAQPFLGCNARMLSIAVVIALIITGMSACAAYFFTRDTILPTISEIDPSDGATIPFATRVRIHATFQDNRAINVKTVLLVLDGRDVTSQALVSDTNINFSTDFDPGQHVVLVEVRDTSNNRATKAWQFTIAAALQPTVTPTLTPSVTPSPTATRSPTPTVTGTRPAPPTINTFSANQTLITKDTSVLLTWSVSNADIVFLNQERVDPSGTRLVTPTKTTTYQLLANNAGGTVDRNVTITVQELPDLIVTDISTNSLNQVSYTVRNVGSADVTRPFLIQVTANDIPIESDRPVAVLPAGQETRLNVPGYTLIGAQVIAVRLNVLLEVQESNYNNNELVRALTGALPTPTSTLTPSSTPTQTPTPTRTRTPSPTP